MAQSRGDESSTLLLDEFFDAGDDRFPEQLRKCSAAKKLAGLADRWKKDPRPWAREQLFAYLDQPMDVPGHHPLVKRLFKEAEANADDELMGAFLVAFDRLVRRVRRTGGRWDWDTRTFVQEERLQSPQDTILAKKNREAINPRTGERIQMPVREGSRLFSYHTRYYLRRRAWRYFRRAGYQRPDDYTGIVTEALKRFREDDFAKGENLLDSWGFMNACFRHHEVLAFGVSRIEVQDGHGLGELSPAPRFPELWKKPEAFQHLLTLVTEAGARPVRVWAMQLLNRDHAERLSSCEADALLAMLDHEDEEVQQFGAGLLDRAEGLAKLPLDKWLGLLQTKNLTALQSICEAMKKHVSAERLELAQCIEICCSEAAPAAGLGLGFLKERAVDTPEDREAISAVSQTKCEAHGREIAIWALRILGTKEHYDVENVTRFFDSLIQPVREGAWDWLVPESSGYNDAALWSRLLETPYDDVRMHLVDALEARSKLPGAGVGDLAPIWTSVLLAVHRGGRQKLKALRQISALVVEKPEHAETLLPVLSVTLRSVRPAERRAGLSAVVSIVERQPELAAVVRERIPELQFEAVEPSSQ